MLSSIDKKELEKFADISHAWWDEKGEFGILHQINPIRLNYIIDKITRHYNIKRESRDFADLSLLDVGCGGGLMSSELSKLGFNVTAIDALDSNINTAENHAAMHNLQINYIRSTIEELPKNQLYDIVICLEVIEHVHNPSLFVQNIIRHLKRGGIAIISTINRNKKAYIFAILVAEYLLNLVPKGTHDYNKFIKPSEIYEMLKNTNASIQELKGLVFSIYNNKWQLSDDIDVNYFACLKNG